jgi:hypothetical protein
MRQQVLPKRWFFRVAEPEDKAAGSSRMLVPVYQTASYHMPEGCNLGEEKSV